MKLIILPVGYYPCPHYNMTISNCRSLNEYPHGRSSKARHTGPGSPSRVTTHRARVIYMYINPYVFLPYTPLFLRGHRNCIPPSFLHILFPPLSPPSYHCVIPSRPPSIQVTKFQLISLKFNVLPTTDCQSTSVHECTTREPVLSQG